MTQKDEKSSFERHFQTVLLSVITVAICWGSSQIFNLSISVAKLQVAIEQLTADRGKFVTMEYALERQKARDSQMIELDRRLTKIENKIETNRPH